MGGRRNARRGAARAVGCLTVVLVAIAAPCGTARAGRLDSARTLAAQGQAFVREPGSQPPAASAIEVSLDPEATGLTVSAVDEALRAYLADTGLSVEVHASAGPPATPHDPAKVRVWLTRADDGSLHIELWLPGHEGAWTRVLPDAGDPALLVEELGVVVRGMVLPRTRHGDEPAPEPTPPVVTEAAPPSTPPPPTPPGPTGAWDLRVGYRGGTFSSEIPWHHGLELAAGLRIHRFAIAELAAAWVPPQREGGVAIQRVPIDLAGGIRLRADARVRVALLGVVTVEALGWSGAAAGFRAAPGWTARLGLGAAADLRVGLSQALFGYVRATARGWPADTALVVETAQGRETLAQGPRLSAAASVGLGVRFFFIRNRPRDATSRSHEDD